MSILIAMAIPPGITTENWEAWLEHFRAGRELNHAFDRRLQTDAGISHPEYLVLYVLAGIEDHKLRTGELADTLAWEKSRLSHQVTRMVARGLVQRTTVETDGRGVWVSLTEHGKATLDAATTDHMQAIQTWFFGVLTDEELAVIRVASHKMREKLLADGAVPRRPRDNSQLPWTTAG